MVSQSISRRKNLVYILTSFPLFLFFSRPLKPSVHNLCTEVTPSPNIQSLLVLGLKFFLQKNTSTIPKQAQKYVDRSTRDIYTKILLSHLYSDFNKKQLRIRIDWEPTKDQIPIKLRVRVQQCLKHLKCQFFQRRCFNNLNTYQK